MTSDCFIVGEDGMIQNVGLNGSLAFPIFLEYSEKERREKEGNVIDKGWGDRKEGMIFRE